MEILQTYKGIKKKRTGSYFTQYCKNYYTILELIYSEVRANYHIFCKYVKHIWMALAWQQKWSFVEESL